jgi:hypothetical protein
MMGNRLPLARVAWRALPLLEKLDADEVAQIFEISQACTVKMRTHANTQRHRHTDDQRHRDTDTHTFFSVYVFLCLSLSPPPFHGVTRSWIPSAVSSPLSSMAHRSFRLPHLLVPNAAMKGYYLILHIQWFMVWVIFPSHPHMVSNILQVAVYEAGQDLMVEGCPAESFFMVEEGSLELTRHRFKVRSGPVPHAWAECFTARVECTQPPFSVAPSACARARVRAYVCFVRVVYVCCMCVSVLYDVHMWCGVRAASPFLSFLFVYSSTRTRSSL